MTTAIDGVTRPGGLWKEAERACAALAVALAATRFQVGNGITVGIVVAILLAPCWAPVLWQNRTARLVVIACAAAVANGILLTVLISGHSTSLNRAIERSFLLVSLATGVCVVAWALRLMRPGAVVAWFGVGHFLGINPGSDLFASNPFRFGFSVPITVLALGLVALGTRRIVDVAVLLALAGASAVNDARSSFAILTLAGIILLTEHARKRSPGKRSSVMGSTIALVVGVAALYSLGQAAIMDGYLGDDTRARTEAQIEQSGSLLLGGRPEIAATLGLMQNTPAGFGSGTLPNAHDIAVAKNSLAGINYDPDNGYVERYMFGSGFELHSVLGDSWARFGWCGVLLTVVMLVVTLRGFAGARANAMLYGIVAFLTLKTLWNLAFAPLYSATPLLILTLGLASVLGEAPRDTARAGSPRASRDVVSAA